MLKNWGFRIVILFLGFVALIAVLVYKAMNEKVDLVSEDYYAQELKYQELIDRLNNSKALLEPIRLKQSNQVLQLQFPECFTANEISGQIRIFVPSDASKDENITIHTDAAKQQFVDISHLSKGNYMVKIIWQARGVPYYFEQRMYK